MEKLSVIIPVYNELATIAEIIRRVEEAKIPVVKEIILVDDGSTDGSREYLRQLSGRHTVVLHEKNRGKGAAVRSGLGRATGRWIIVQDADLEYDPADYGRLLRALQESRADAVYGSRNLQPNSRSSRRYYYGGRLITALMNLLFGSRLTDVNTCYKLFNAAALRCLQVESDRFSFCEEVTAKLLRQGSVIREIPISYHPRTFAEGKKIRFHDGIAAVAVILKHRFRR